MQAAATLVKNNFGKYLDIAQHEPVRITKNGHTVAVLMGADTDRAFLADKLLGIIPSDTDENRLKAERRAKL